jgi:hypothetical protein
MKTMRVGGLHCDHGWFFIPPCVCLCVCVDVSQSTPMLDRLGFSNTTLTLNNMAFQPLPLSLALSGSISTDTSRANVDLVLSSQNGASVCGLVFHGDGLMFNTAFDLITGGRKQSFLEIDSVDITMATASFNASQSPMLNIFPPTLFSIVPAGLTLNVVGSFSPVSETPVLRMLAKLVPGQWQMLMTLNKTTVSGKAWLQNITFGEKAHIRLSNVNAFVGLGRNGMHVLCMCD